MVRSRGVKSTVLVPIPIRWRKLRHELLTPEEAEVVEQRVSSVLQSWRGTPYKAGSCARGLDGGVDCVRFVGPGVLDELYGYQREKIERYPPDIGMHDRAAAIKAMHTILRIYEPNGRVEGNIVEAGDVIMVGPAKGGPSHAMFVDARPNHLWHATHDGVISAGTLQPVGTQYAVFRVLDKHMWYPR